MGAYEREAIDGGATQYKTLNRIETDDIIVNKIWARNGSVAVVPAKLAGTHASGEFPTFSSMPDRLHPRWVHWITKAKWFWEQCDDKSHGTSGKNRIRPEQFLRVTIPLPPLPEQQRIVARIEELAGKIERARGLRTLAVAEVDALTNRTVKDQYDDLVAKHGWRSLGELLIGAGYGTSVKCDSERHKDAIPVLRIPNVASEKVNLMDMKYGSISVAELKRVLVNEGDVLVVRTNGSADLVGRSAVVPGLDEPTAFASYMIRLRCDSSTIHAEYLQT
jgi:hypothetical protein